MVAPPKPTYIERTRKSNSNKWMALYVCHCGVEFECVEAAIRSGNTKSCGCLQKETIAKLNRTIGHTADKRYTKTYTSWLEMRKRCYKSKTPYFELYGGRGIKVCDRWKDSFVNFFRDMGFRPEGTTLDRIDPEKDYTLDNCRWATHREQVLNRRNTIRHLFYGVSLTVSEWADLMEVGRARVYQRIKRGSSIFDAIFQGRKRAKT